MAQGTSADCFVALICRLTSAGILIPALVAFSLLAFPGCGGGSDTGTQSPAASIEVGEAKASPKRKPPSAPQKTQTGGKSQITLESPDFSSGGSGKEIPAAYTCDGDDISPEFRWSGVPPDSAELVFLAINPEPVRGVLFFDWAVAGLDPSLKGLKPDQLPKGAVVGENVFGKNGYSICPEENGRKEKYVFVLYAVPHSFPADEGFAPITLRKEILGGARNTGLLVAFYQRR